MPKRFSAQKDRYLDWANFDAAFLAQYESERGKVILGAARLDDLLRELLTRAMIRNANAVNNLLDVEKPLGGFGARVTAAYCLGLIGNNDYKNLRLIQVMRNAFAHNLHDISFASQWVVDRCNEFEFPENTMVPGQTYSSLQKYVLAMRVVEFQLQDRIEDMPEPPQVAREIEWALDDGHIITTQGYVEPKAGSKS